MSLITASDVNIESSKGFVSKSVTVTVDLKKTFLVTVSFNPAGVQTGIRTTCKNASHRAWMGAGRGFPTFEAAIAGYKSTAAKVAIEEAAARLGDC